MKVFPQWAVAGRTWIHRPEPDGDIGAEDLLPLGPTHPLLPLLVDAEQLGKGIHAFHQGSLVSKVGDRNGV
jgi:hypothetical protein